MTLDAACMNLTFSRSSRCIAISVPCKKKNFWCPDIDLQPTYAQLNEEDGCRKALCALFCPAITEFDGKDISLC